MNNVLVTGANRGIGLAFVSEYLQRGSRVIATCGQPSQAKQLHELQQTYGEPPSPGSSTTMRPGLIPAKN